MTTLSGSGLETTVHAMDGDLRTRVDDLAAMTTDDQRSADSDLVASSDLRHDVRHNVCWLPSRAATQSAATISTRSRRCKAELQSSNLRRSLQLAQQRKVNTAVATRAVCRAFRRVLDGAVLSSACCRVFIYISVIRSYSTTVVV